MIRDSIWKQSHQVPKAGTKPSGRKASELPVFIHDPSRILHTHLALDFQEAFNPLAPRALNPEPLSPQSFSPVLCFAQGEEDESKEATNCQGLHCNFGIYKNQNFRYRHDTGKILEVKALV